MSVIIKDLDIDSHRVIKCFIVPYKDRAQLVIGNKYDAGKTYDIFEVSTQHGEWYPIELDDDDYKADCCYRCSECGFIRDAYLLEEDEYCPKCGSKMRYDH